MKSTRLLSVLCMTVFAFRSSASIVLPDSLIAEENVYEFSVASPDTALAIIDVLRESDTIENWHINFIEGNYYVNRRQFRKASSCYVQALEDPGIKYLPQQQMRVLMRLISVCEHLQNDDDMVKYAYRMERIAEGLQNNYYLYTARFVLAKRRHFQGDSTGIADCLKAIEKIKQCDIPYKNNLLSYCYADLLRAHAVEADYDKAMQMSLLQEQVSKNLAPISQFQIDANALRKTYAMRACLLAMMGRMDDAAETYRMWEQTPHPNASDDKLILDYLMAANRYDEALEVIKAYKQYLVHEGDSISHWMLYALSQEFIVKNSRGEPSETSRLNAEMFSITNDLHKMRSKEVMNTTYELLRQQEESHHRYLMLNYIGIAVFILVLIIIVFIYYTRQVNKRNKVLATLANGLEAYRYMLDKNELNSASSAEQRIQDVHDSEQPRKAQEPETQNRVDEQELNKGVLQRLRMSDDDKRLFVLMDRLVVRDKLFLNPNLNREDLMNLLGIDKNRFGKMMSRYSTTSNASSYISAKRAEYAAELLCKHPEFTIAAIAEMCGMSNTVTLNRSFKQLYGVTPSEYRSNFESGNKN